MRKNNLIFSTGDLVNIVGITLNQLNDMLRKFSAISPSIRRGSGRGSSKHLWSLTDMYRVAIFKKLNDTGTGLSRKLASHYISAIDDYDFDIVFNYLDRTEIRSSLEKVESILSHLEGLNSPPHLPPNFLPHTLQIKELGHQLFRRATELDPGIRIYFVFTRQLLSPDDLPGEQGSIDAEYNCFPVVEYMRDDLPRDIGIDTMHDLLNNCIDLSDAYLINFGKLIGQIDNKIRMFYGPSYWTWLAQIIGIKGAVRDWDETDQCEYASPMIEGKKNDRKKIS